MRRSAFPGFWGVKIFFPVKRRLWEDTESEIFSEMEDIFLVWISIAGREEIFWRGVWGSLEAEQDVCDYEKGLEVNDGDGDKESWARGNLGTYSQWREWPKEFANKGRRAINVERLRR